MTASSPITVTGSIAYDYLSLYEQPFETVLLPENLDRLSVCFFVRTKSRHFGGTCGNIGFNFSLMNEFPVLLGAVGNDFEVYEQWLVEHGLSVTHLRHYPELATASATIITDPCGHQIAEFYPGAMAGEGFIPTDESFQKSALVLIAPDDPVRMKQYVRDAQRLGSTYFFDPGQGLPMFTADELLSAITGAEGVFVNEYEWEMLREKLKLSPEEFLNHSHLLIVTQGEAGSTLYSKDGSGNIETHSIPVGTPHAVVDPTGCGDAYRAGFLKGYKEGRDLVTCGRLGSLMATYVVEQTGTQNHTFSWEEFQARYLETFGSAL